MRLIDADALAKFIDYGHLNNPNENLYSENDIREMIDMMPVFNVVLDFQAETPKHGHWIEVQRIHETDHTAICECSLCGDTVWVYDGQRAWNYCPNCGAKMAEVIDKWEEPEINPCRGCDDYDGKGGCKSNGGCGR